MKAEYLDLLGEEIFIRYRIKDGNNPPVLFIHGIGESGRCFFDAFDLTDKYNIVVPDLLGHGKSQKAAKNPDYSLSRQIKIIWGIIDHFGLKDIILVGHSFGGMLGSLICKEDKHEKIKKFLNVEGGISRDTTILSLRAVRVLEGFNHDMEKFGYWLHEGEFKNLMLEDYESASTIKYFDSVIECDPEAFAQTAVEICSRLEFEDKKGINEFSRAYGGIRIPKLYCVGTRPVMNSAKRLLINNHMEYKEFNVASHWLMLDKREEFYTFLEGFIES